MNGKLKYYVLILSFLLFGSLVIFRPPEILAKIILYCFFANTILAWVLFADFVVSENIKFYRRFFRKNKTDDEAESTE